MLRKIIKISPTIKYNTSAFSTQTSLLTYIQHAFDRTEASKRFVEAESRRFFAPIKQSRDELVIRDKDPITQALIPFYGINASFDVTHYSGQYGVDRPVTTHTPGPNNTTITTYHIETDWHYISGTLKPLSFNQEMPYMIIYAGFRWSSKILEYAHQGYKINAYLEPFNVHSIHKSVHIDPFLKRVNIATKVASKRLDNEIEENIRKDIRKRSGHSQARVSSYQTNYLSFELKSFLLPAYILQYPDLPPQVLPALFENITEVHGSSPLSVSKCMAFAGGTTLLLSALMPQIALPLRAAFIIGSSTLTGLWAKYRPARQFYSQENQLKREKAENETVYETSSDRLRFEETARDFKPIFIKENEDPEWIDFCKKMDLDPKKPLTEEEVRTAFNKLILIKHPDQGGTREETEELFYVKDGLLKKIRQTKKDPNQRSFSTVTKAGFVGKYSLFYHSKDSVQSPNYLAAIRNRK